MRQRDQVLAEAILLLWRQWIDATIALEFIDRDGQIRQRVAQPSAEVHQLHYITRSEPCDLSKARDTFNARVSPVAVGAQGGESCGRSKSFRHRTAIRFQHQSMCTKGSHLNLGRRLTRYTKHRLRFEVHGSGEGRCAGAARSDAALHLHRPKTRRKIGEVGKVEHLIFRIVERNAIDREVDARLVHAAQSQVAVAPVRA